MAICTSKGEDSCLQVYEETALIELFIKLYLRNRIYVKGNLINNLETEKTRNSAK